MNYSSLALRRGVAAITGALYLLVLSACNNAPMAPMAPNAKGARAQVTCSSGYCWYKVDHLGTSTFNNVTGINDSRDIVGNYDTGTACTGGTSVSQCADCPLVLGGGTANGDEWRSFYGTHETTSSDFSTQVEMYPFAQSQYLYGVSNNSGTQNTRIGCLVNAGNFNGGLDWTAGLSQYAGIWNFTSQTVEGKGCTPESVAGLFAVDNAGVAVGYFNLESDGCAVKPWQDQPGDNHKKINVSITGLGTNANAEATGISSSGGYMVGTATISGRSEGWYTPTNTASSYSANPVTYEGNPTVFTGIATVSSRPKIVGWYTKSSKTHGLVGSVSGSTYSWTSLDEPNANTLTVISGTNDNGDICGWYDDSSGKRHGFVGLAISTGARRNAHQNRVRPRT